MEKRSFMLMLIIALTSVFSGCGGGSSGGNGGEVPSFAGVYNIDLFRVEDSCRLNHLPLTASGSHTVRQDGNRVAVDTGTVTLNGFVNDERDGFVVSIKTFSHDCHNTSSFGYLPPEVSGADYFVGWIIRTACGGLTGQTSYAGHAVRVR